jgi:transketolase N-terminal domain/subunit
LYACLRVKKNYQNETKINDLRQCSTQEHPNLKIQQTQKPATKAKRRKIQYNLEKQPKHNNQSLSMLNTTCLNHQKNKKKNQKKKQKAKSIIMVNKK